MSEGSLLNALKLKLLEEQKELQELRLNLEKCQDDLNVETEKRAEVNLVYIMYTFCMPVGGGHTVHSVGRCCRCYVHCVVACGKGVRYRGTAV